MYGESEWIYDRGSPPWWHDDLDFQLGINWSFDLAPWVICYKAETLKIEDRDVDLYCLNIIQPTQSMNWTVQDFNLASIIRYVYEFEHEEDPIYIEDGLDFKRRNKLLSFGRFKTKEDAIKHASKRLSALDERYQISDENAEKFPIPLDEFDKHQKVFDVYIPHVNSTQNICGFTVDDVMMFNASADEVEDFYRIRVPFIKVGLKQKRRLFGVKEMLADVDKDSGLMLYVKKKDVGFSIVGLVGKMADEILEKLMFEIIATEKKYGPQDIPEELIEDGDFQLT